MFPFTMTNYPTSSGVPWVSPRESHILGYLSVLGHALVEHPSDPSMNCKVWQRCGLAKMCVSASDRPKFIHILVCAMWLSSCVTSGSYILFQNVGSMSLLCEVLTSPGTPFPLAHFAPCHRPVFFLQHAQLTLPHCTPCSRSTRPGCSQRGSSLSFGSLLTCSLP